MLPSGTPSCKPGYPYDIAPGYPNLIDRIEGGLLSYGNEMTRENNPFEVGLGKFCNLNGAVDYLSRAALQKLSSNGIERQIRGILFDGGPCPNCAEPWPVKAATDRQVGQITSAIWSPRLKRNVGLSLIDKEFWDVGQPLIVHSKDGVTRVGEVSALPFRLTGQSQANLSIEPYSRAFQFLEKTARRVIGPQ